ncbi:LytR/AlgR family response regulator transcription factor [Sphingobacterium sp. MYb382]|uniref:LytR/AlgR family response regulator transcription factor n=1 Tax=Sphingobacterium sp. MYb382 TaxID=2745278 RepID=UPI003094B70A
MTNIVSKQPVLKLKCLIVDDEENAIDGVVDYLQDIEAIEVVGTCLSAIEALEFLKKQEVDLLFLDINMPRLTGLELLESMQNPPLVILTTAYSEYALDGFRLNVVDYLLKPYTFQRFFQAAQKAIDLYKSQVVLNSKDDGKAIDMYIRQGDSFQRINWEDILFVEAMQNYLKLHFVDTVFVIHQTMTSLAETLPKDSFFRIHNSYLVNINHIDKINGGRLFVNGTELPISKHRKDEFLNAVVYKGLISK